MAGIPAYNVEKTIRHVVETSGKYVDKVIVVDDGSKDMTAKMSEEAGAVVIRHKKNRGIGAARTAILRKAVEMNADVLVMLDGDGQHDPNDISRLIEAMLKDDADICVGYRMAEKGHMPLYRRFGLWILNKSISLAVGEKIRDTQSGFMAFSKRAMKEIKFTEGGMAIAVEFWYQVIRKGLTFQEVPVVINYRQVNGSNVNPFLHGLTISNLLVKKIARQRPFLFLGLPGLIIFIVSLVLMGVVLNTYLVTRELALGLMIPSILGIMVGVLLILVSLLLFVLSDILMKMDDYFSERSSGS